MRTLLSLIALTAPLLLAAGEPARPPGGQGGQGGARMPAPAFRTEVPRQLLNVILGRPTDRGVTASVLLYEGGEAYLEYGGADGQPPRQTFPQAFRPGEPGLITLSGLAPHTRHTYRLRHRAAGQGDFAAGPEGAFMTARAPGTPFTFTIQADPHLDFGIDPPTYEKALRQVLAAGSDFHIDLGDTFMTDKYPSYQDAAPQYLAQRYYFGLIGASVPVYLVLGNHDGEQPGRGGDEAMALWSNGMRKRYFANPEPDAFYSGNRTPHPRAGLLQDYYAWEWGDALFIALDPFWNSPRSRKGADDNWGRTLGRAQYDWLTQTLAASRARFRFVFLHHLVGGATPEGRGGAEAVPYFEWGGRDLDGREAFASRRPGWPAPIHDVLRKHQVSAVFHGHDHLYAYQERDGIVYQLVPQPGHSRTDNTRSAEEYTYRSGVILGASGILRVRVTPDEAQVEYVRAYPDRNEDAQHRTGAVTHRYVIAPKFRP